jgi:hypothetical protein
MYKEQLKYQISDYLLDVGAGVKRRADKRGSNSQAQESVLFFKYYTVTEDVNVISTD